MNDHDAAAIWFTLAMLNAGVAQGKNRSGVKWFLLSLWLGPFATFLLVAMFKKLPEAATRHSIPAL